MQLFLLFGELLLLYILAARLTQGLYDLTVLLFRSRTAGVMVVTILNFPGTVIHELSHLFTAEVLGVKTGKLTLVPENIREEEIKAGSVMIAATDPFRRYAVGLAPVFVGMITISALSYFLPSLWNTLIVSELPWYSNPTFYYLLLAMYALLAVSNSMFSSKEDLKGFIPFILAIAILGTAAYIAGIRVGITGPVLVFFLRILDALTKSLGIVFVLNIAGLLFIRVLIALMEKITRRKIIKR